MDKIKYDMAKGFHGNIDQVPKDFRDLVIQQFKAQNPNADIDKFILDVDIYISVDLRNYWKKN